MKLVVPDDVPPVGAGCCPACGDDLFTPEYGCTKCGHGKKSFVARHSESLPLLGAFALFAFGIGGVALSAGISRDNVTQGVLLANGIFILTGVFLFGYGIRAFQNPTSIVIQDVAGTDAWGRQRYGNSRVATARQGRTVGVICVLIGSVGVIAGAFIGPIAHVLGIPTH